MVATVGLPEIRYINSSALKVAIADWHRQSFLRVEDEARSTDFFRVQFLDALAHSDGVFLQLAAAFDAFACAVAFKAGLTNPHKADFGGWNKDLVRAAGGDLGDRIRSTAAEPGFERLTSHRNVVAHRFMVVGRIVLRANEETDRDEVRFTVGDPPPIGSPDPALTPVRDILTRDFDWARGALYDLYPEALAAWGLTDNKDLRADLGLRGELPTTPSMQDREVHIPITEEELNEEWP